MYGTMTVSSLLPSLLLLLLTAYFQRAEAKKSEEAKDQDSELLGFWKQHFRDSRLKRKGEAVKQMLLYCRAGIGYHLQILPEGTVGGIHRPDPYCWLKLFAMRPGVVGIRGVKSGLYLCMTEHGLAYGAEKFTDNCLFKESLEENHYTTYSSLSTPGNYLAISHRGQLRRGNSVGRNQSCAHFLPRII
ncbi:fibroblast growth factor 4A [Cyprinodon tularosa]|uniref:fibroblast growth factor 4A n=1 Tax=Cyprinodon tularosa TaxID=77115 RepID=UPI0018E27D10|nr:fibroblast growth factor 4A [Cyprinodon tularosa]